MKDRAGLDLHLHNDRESLHGDSLPIWLADILSERNLTTGPQNKTVSFCGLLMNGHELRVFLPRNVSSPPESKDQLRLTVLLTSSVERYGRESSTRIHAGDADPQLTGSNLLTVVKELLEDYRLNGSYIRSLRKRVINSGKTDWKRTLSKVTPLPSRSGKPVYTELHGRKTEYAAYCEVARVHHAVIARLDRMFGWWITGRVDGRIAADLSEESLLLDNRDYCLRVLQRELQGCYADRNIRLIKQLISYLKEESGTGKGTVLVGLKDFHHAWEAMLNQVLDFNYPMMNKELPEPVYFNMQGVPMPASEKKMRTDTVLEKKSERRIVIVDAKYYGADKLNDLPGWGDLVKQFFYAKAVKKIRQGFVISNAFIFPGTKAFASEVRVGLPETAEFFDDEFIPVHCIYADPVEVMRNYINRIKMAGLTDHLFAIGTDAT